MLLRVRATYSQPAGEDRTTYALHSHASSSDAVRTTSTCSRSHSNVCANGGCNFVDEVVESILFPDLPEARNRDDVVAPWLARHSLDQFSWCSSSDGNPKYFRNFLQPLGRRECIFLAQRPSVGDHQHH